MECDKGLVGAVPSRLMMVEMKIDGVGESCRCTTPPGYAVEAFFKSLPRTYTRRFSSTLLIDFFTTFDDISFVPWHRC